MQNIFENIKKDFVEPIKARTKSENPVADGIKCPHCGALETYKNPENPNDTMLWFWVIKAYKIDDFSFCTNCDKWFGL